ncbi:MAG: PEP-CTERM sorting domain-containing protein [Planctomycetota bacterium]
MTHPAGRRAAPLLFPASALLAGSAFSPAALAAPGDIVFQDDFATQPLAIDGAVPPPRWGVAIESFPRSEWRSDPGPDGQPGLMFIDGGFIETLAPIPIDEQKFYRVSMQANGASSQPISLNFRWQYAGTGQWETYEALIPGYAAAFSENGSARVRVVGRNTIGYLADDVVVEEATFAQAAAWGDQVLAEVPITPKTARYVRADQTIQSSLTKLQNGETVRVVMLGDSIVADTSMSTWAAQVSNHYPGQLEVIPTIRNGTGMEFYQGVVESEDEGLGPVGTPRLQGTVLDFDPDLVILGGVSHGFNSSAYASVIDQLQAEGVSDIVIATEAGGYNTGQTEYLLPDWEFDIDPTGDQFEAELLALARAEGVGFADLRGTWGQALNDAEAEPGIFASTFHRDSVHGNHLGQELMGLALSEFFILPDEADANGDGAVDLLDFDALAFSFGLIAGGTFEKGDFNGDGDVNLLDFDILANNFDNGAPPPPAQVAIPEPASLSLLGLAGLATLRRRRG